MKISLLPFLSLPLLLECVSGAVISATGEAELLERHVSKYTSVPEGETWYDTAGEAISAWGGNLLLKGSTYYWVGQAFPWSSGETSETALVK